MRISLSLRSSKTFCLSFWSLLFTCVQLAQNSEDTDERNCGLTNSHDDAIIVGGSSFRLSSVIFATFFKYLGLMICSR